MHLVIPPDPNGQWLAVYDELLTGGTLAPRFPRPLRGEMDPLFKPRLIAAAEMTGGAAHSTGRSGSLLRPLTRILNDYRRSYILQYELTGIPREGWHDIDVTITRRGTFDVVARRGYFID